MEPVTARLTESHLGSMRSAAIGGASVSTAIVLLLLQTGISDAALKLALYTACVAIQAWIAAWQYIEAYNFYGRASYKHFNTPKGSGVAVALSLAGIVGLSISVAALIWHLAPLAALIFSASSVVTLVLVVRHNNAVKRVTDASEPQGAA